MLTFFQAIVLGVLQGVTELFPVASLGHSVILPQLLGWTDVVAAQSASESCFLAFLVGLHVATALALLAFYRSTWARIVRGLIASLRTRRIETPDHRLAWLLVVATIPAGLVGLLLEHTLRVGAASPKLGRTSYRADFGTPSRQVHVEVKHAHAPLARTARCRGCDSGDQRPWRKRWFDSTWRWSRRWPRIATRAASPG